MLFDKVIIRSAAILALLLSAGSGTLHAQSEIYFPQTPTRWAYTDVALDSLQNPVDSLRFTRIAEYVGNRTLEGKIARLIYNDAAIPILFSVSDTSYLALEGNYGYEYLSLTPFDTDSIELPDSLDIFSFLSQFQGWYNVYRFAVDPDLQYPIFQFDTTLAFDSVSFPIGIRVTGARLPDADVSVPAGDFIGVKRFVITFAVGTLFPVPPYPFLPLLQMTDSLWIAPGHWIVRFVRPSVAPDTSLVALGMPGFYIPGQMSELASVTEVAGGNDAAKPNDYLILNAFPNPFNPSVTLSAELPMPGTVDMSIFDIHGRRVWGTTDVAYQPGTFATRWSSAGASSGVYIAVLKHNGRTATTRIMLVK